MTNVNRRETSRQREALNKRYEAKYFPKVKAAIKSKVDAVIRGIEYYGNVRDGIREAESDLANTRLTNVIDTMYREVGLRYARKQWIEFNNQKRERKSIEDILHKGFGFNAEWVSFIKDYLYRFLLEKITFEVAKTTRDILMTTLNQAIAEGWGVDQTVRALDGLPLSASQAARIVRTEITRAANTGLSAASSTYDFEQTKEWIAAKDTRTRGNPFNGIDDHASHWALDGVTIDSGDYFTDPRNGDKLLVPGDPNASAASTINCRCSVAYVSKIDERGRLIPRAGSFIKEAVIEKHFTETIIEKSPIDVFQLLSGVETLKKQVQVFGDEIMRPSEVPGLLENIYEKAEQLRELVEGKNYQPIINVNQDTVVFVQAVDSLMREIRKMIGELAVSLKRPKKWNFTIIRDSSGVITNIQAQANE